MGKLTRIGIDTSKSVFQLHGVDDGKQPALKRKLRRQDLNKFFGSLARLRIGMEACGASHHWARELQALGHEVVLIPPQAATETAEMLGARVAETISGADIMSVQTGHMIASDPTTHLTLLASEGPSTYGNWILVVRRSLRSGRRGQSC